MDAQLAEKVSSLPAAPGVYLMKSAAAKVLYVGKAQNLRARVRSYFRAGGSGDGRPRVPALVRRIADISIVATPGAKDALLLENELIKQHKPPFNVQFRDDKQYSGLRLDPREMWPRLQRVRRFKNDGAQYFGPYTQGAALHRVLEQLQRIFRLRNCRDGVFRDHQRRGRPCLEYEMKRCPGPCCGLVSQQDYATQVQGAEMFLRGRADELLKALEKRMRAAAAAEQFEAAAQLRDQISAIKQTLERQQVVTGPRVNRDVFGLARAGGELCIQTLHVREGRITGANAHCHSGMEGDDAELLSSFLMQFYSEKNGSESGESANRVPAEVLLSTDLPDAEALAALLGERAGRAARLRRPLRGPARELTQLAANNAALELQRRVEARDSITRALAELQQRLQLPAPPKRIECYDISNLSGTLAVGSRVVFEMGQPQKNLYRRYRIREAAAGDDLACMREVLQRRLARRETEAPPDLLLLDGGRGQLNVLSALLGDMGLKVPHAALAKERAAADTGDLNAANVVRAPRVKRGGGLKAERVFLPRRKNPVLLPPSSRALLLLQRMRDEAHRFAIEFQRRLRRKQGLLSVLEEIPGIGPNKRRALLRELGSLRRIRAADAAQLSRVPGISPRDAEVVAEFFRALAQAERTTL